MSIIRVAPFKGDVKHLWPKKACESWNEGDVCEFSSDLADCEASDPRTFE